MKNKYFLLVKFINNFMLIKCENKKEVRIMSTSCVIPVMPKFTAGKKPKS